MPFHQCEEYEIIVLIQLSAYNFVATEQGSSNFTAQCTKLLVVARDLSFVLIVLFSLEKTDFTALRENCQLIAIL